MCAFFFVFSSNRNMLQKIILFLFAILHCLSKNYTMWFLDTDRVKIKQFCTLRKWTERSVQASKTETLPVARKQYWLGHYPQMNRLATNLPQIICFTKFVHLDKTTSFLQNHLTCLSFFFLLLRSTNLIPWLKLITTVYGTVNK